MSSAARPRLRVVIADDEVLVRTGFRVILQSEEDFDVVGEAENGEAAVSACRRWRPDVVLMDVRMPVMNGLEATRRALAAVPACRVIVLTTFDLDENVYAAIAAGASGFLRQVARRPRAEQAGRARPRAGGGAGVRDRPGRAGSRRPLRHITRTR